MTRNERRFIVDSRFGGAWTRPSSVLLEPVGHKTALGIVVATIVELRISPDALLLVILADHVILNEAAVDVAISEYQISATAKIKVVAQPSADGVDASRIQACAASYLDASQTRLRKISSCPVPPSH